MNTLILAAGRGSRLRPFTNEVPKPLLEVSGTSIISRLVNACALPELFGTVFVNISHLPSAFVESRKTLEATFLYERLLLGPTESILGLLARENDDLLVIHGDLLLDAPDIQTFAKYCQSQNYSQIVVHKRVRYKARSHILFDERGLVIECVGFSHLEDSQINRTPGSILKNRKKIYSDSGIYFLRKKDMSNLKLLNYGGSVRDGIMAPLAKKKALKAYIWSGRRFSIEFPADLDRARLVW